MLRPVTDDMALCHPSLQDGNGKIRVTDAEAAWFVRVNHINNYGTDTYLERITAQPDQPLLFLNIDAVPGGRALIWEHIQDAPGKPCPNPRVIIPRAGFPDIVDGAVAVDVRSFGVRTPPCTREKPTYGIIGLFHLLPPALAWLWRLVSPRGYDNPSIVELEGMESEGVGSYWPFATGQRVTQANLLLEQFTHYHNTRYILTPNQHVGAWKRGFMPQWVAREYLARRGTAPLHARPDPPGALRPAGDDAAPAARGGAHDRPLVPAGEHPAGSRRRSLRPGRGDPVQLLPALLERLPEARPAPAGQADHRMLPGSGLRGGLRDFNSFGIRLFES